MGAFEDVMGPQGAYRLSDVSMVVIDGYARFSALLIGPDSKNVWARAWIGSDQGTLGETSSPKHLAGEAVTLDVPLPASTRGYAAYMRIESAPLQTEHVVSHRFE